jgi:hypothetical protein
MMWTLRSADEVHPAEFSAKAKGELNSASTIGDAADDGGRLMLGPIPGPVGNQNLGATSPTS